MLTQLVKFKIRSCFDWAQHERILRVRTDLFRIKRGLGRTDFQVDARVLRRGLLDNGYNEIPIGSKPTRQPDRTLSNRYRRFNTVSADIE
jgi:hypothetical protein